MSKSTLIEEWTTHQHTIKLTIETINQQPPSCCIEAFIAQGGSRVTARFTSPAEAHALGEALQQAALKAGFKTQGER